jgi:predicted NUDIX family phosphoesterase
MARGKGWQAMNDQDQERVLVVPTRVLHEAGLFQGFTPRVAHYLPRLLDPAHLGYLPRAQAETDPSFKQIIPYVVLQWGEQVFAYVRGQGGGEARLRALRSIGVGGHVSADDDGQAETPYREALARELAEEVEIDSAYVEHCIGLINDDSTPVGQVHLGVVHVLELERPRVRRREEVLTQAGFAPLADLQRCRDEFETWSRVLLEGEVLS